MTWDGNYADLYVVELETGERQRVIARLSSRSSGRARISPSGRFVSFYRDDAWHLYDRRARALVNATRELGVAFANEDHDYPSDPPGYGQAEWLSARLGLPASGLDR